MQLAVHSDAQFGAEGVSREITDRDVVAFAQSPHVRNDMRAAVPFRNVE